MSSLAYDAIVVGARCAGSPTALLLARQGYRVLLVDRASFPSDTVSTHLIHPPGAAALKRWGLLDRLIATGCPAVHTYAFDMGPFVIEGQPGVDGLPLAYGPRRTVLDKLLLDAAAEAGVQVREQFVVDDLVTEDGRVTGIRGHGKGADSVTEHARVVVGADGVHSFVAGKVSAPAYQEKPQQQASYYTYWSGLPVGNQLRAWDRGNRAMAAWPTHDDLTLLIVSWPIAEFDANRRDIEGNYFDTLARAPEFAERVRAARRAERFIGASVPNFFHKPFGPGWALVGDAGYTRDFITAQGISDAFRDAELCARAIGEWLSGTRAYDEAMGAYQAARDERVTPMYDFTLQFAAMQPPPPETQALFGAIHGNREAMDGFARVFSGVTSPADFFSPANVERIFASKAMSGQRAEGRGQK
jgi:2-polyprenyl-6-methoxyphenol hydroxylase-like FAD-dependent oxidoreductase